MCWSKLLRAAYNLVQTLSFDMLVLMTRATVLFTLGLSFLGAVRGLDNGLGLLVRTNPPRARANPGCPRPPPARSCWTFHRV